MFKKLCALMLILALVLSLSGCSFGNSGEDSLLKPPRPEGDMFEVQQALDRSVSGKYTLKFPTSGDNRSAIMQRDINNDRSKEAIAFYSTVEDNIVTMHINLIVKRGEDWKSAGEYRCIATGVELVDFKDMDNDGLEEIIVGWSVYGTVDKSIAVYSFADGKFTQRSMDPYTHYLCEDIDGDKHLELFISYLDAKSETASAKLLRLKDGVTSVLGYCTLDAAATSYYKPIVGRLSNGNTAIYFDAVKGGGMITEVLEIKDSVMTNALTPENAAPISTYRASNVEIRDLNGDGVYGIPVPILITQVVGAEQENVYMTEWYTIEKDKLELNFKALMNYVDGYYIVVPEKWSGKIAVSRDTPNRIRNIMAIDPKTGNSSDVIIRVQTLPISQKGEEGAIKIENAVEIARNSENCYLVSIGTAATSVQVTLEEFKKMFVVLE